MSNPQPTTALLDRGSFCRSNSISYGDIKQAVSQTATHKKYSMKDLKLRIIHAPLHSTTGSKLCCLCCRDTVGELSRDERVITLTCGFTRESFPEQLPSDIIDLCVSYVGSSKQFEHTVLTSFAENRQEPRLDCLDGWQDLCTDCCKECWSCETFCGDECCCNCWINIINNCCAACCECWKCFQCFTNYSCCFGFAGDILVAILILIAIAITFGKDIAMFIFSKIYKCNVSGGSDYIYFNVYDWMLIGCISDSILWIIMIAFLLGVYLHNKADGTLRICSDKIQGIFIACMGCVWCFFIAWIVIGFLLYAEMIVDTAIDNECKNIVISWNILQLIPTISVICFILIVMAGEGIFSDCCQGCCDCIELCSDWCGYCLDPIFELVGDFYMNIERSCGACLPRYGIGIVRGILVVILIAFFFGKDVSCLIINSYNNCDIIDEESKYVKLFNVTEWLYIGSITHMFIGISFVCWLSAGVTLDIDSSAYFVVGTLFWCCGYLFNISWMVIGFFFYSEMSFTGESNLVCSDIVLSWSVIQGLESVFLVLYLCAACRH
eukprot:58762_1